MCTVLLLQSVNPIEANKYIIPYFLFTLDDGPFRPKHVASTFLMCTISILNFDRQCLVLCIPVTGKCLKDDAASRRYR